MKKRGRATTSGFYLGAAWRAAGGEGEGTSCAVGATAVVERHYERGKARLMSPRPANATQRRYLWRKMRRVICADGITTTEFPPERWMTAIPFRRVVRVRFNGEKSGPRMCILLYPPPFPPRHPSFLPLLLFPPKFPPDYKIMPRISVHPCTNLFALEIPSINCKSTRFLKHYLFL